MKTDREIMKMENIIAAESYLTRVRIDRAHKFFSVKEQMNTIKTTKKNLK